MAGSSCGVLPQKTPSGVKGNDFILTNVSIIFIFIVCRSHPNIQTVVVEMGAGEKIATLSTHKFKPVNEVAGAAGVVTAATGPRVYVMSKASKSEQPATSLGGCAGSGVETAAGVRVQLSKGQRERALNRAIAVLSEVYPKTMDKVVHSQVQGPTLGGLAVSCGPSKFASLLSSASDIEVQSVVVIFMHSYGRVHLMM